MSRKVTITIEDDVYKGLHEAVGEANISRFIEDLVRPHVVSDVLDAGYAAMAADSARESEAQQWCNGLSMDMADEAR